MTRAQMRRFIIWTASCGFLFIVTLTLSVLDGTDTLLGNILASLAATSFAVWPAFTLLLGLGWWE